MDNEKRTICPVCRFYPASEHHHIYPRSLGGDDEKENIRFICPICHRASPSVNKDTEKEDAWEQWEFYEKEGGPLWDIVRVTVMTTLRLLKDKSEVKSYDAESPKEKEIEFLREVEEDIIKSVINHREFMGYIITNKEEILNKPLPDE